MVIEPVFNFINILMSHRKDERRSTLDDVRNLLNSLEVEGLEEKWSAAKFKSKVFHALDSLEPEDDLVHSIKPSGDY